MCANIQIFTHTNAYTCLFRTQTTNWCVEKIEVKVVSGEYIDQIGVVISLQGSDCQVKLHDGGQVI